MGCTIESCIVLSRGCSSHIRVTALNHPFRMNECPFQVTRVFLYLYPHSVTNNILNDEVVVIYVYKVPPNYVIFHVKCL